MSKVMLVLIARARERRESARREREMQEIRERSRRRRMEQERLGRREQRVVYMDDHVIISRSGNLADESERDERMQVSNFKTVHKNATI